VDYLSSKLLNQYGLLHISLAVELNLEEVPFPMGVEAFVPPIDENIHVVYYA
jgi:hypothetical protein